MNNRAALNRLKELTERLPAFSDIVGSTSNGSVQMSMDKGLGLGWSLMYQPDIAVAKWFSSAGSEFPRHSHTEVEYILVWKGELDYITDDKTINLKKGDHLMVEPNIPHRASFKRDTWYLAITIPASPVWPK